MTDFQRPPPLKITCTSVDCAKDLHCFKQLKKMASEERGRCRACGVDLINWKRVHTRDLNDVEHTFEALKRELIRHHFFHKEIDQIAMRHAQRKGLIQLREAARERLTRYLMPAEPVRDGRQTPLQGNAIYYAQHATATCCRTCLEYWHAIPKGRAITPSELEYCSTLVDLFFDLRLANLADGPVKVPRLPRAFAPHQEELHP